MTTLTGTTPANTYKDLLQVSNSNSGIDGTLRVIEDGEGTASPLSLSLTALNVTGALFVDSATGRVGIGDITPECLLDIGGTNAGFVWAPVEIEAGLRIWDAASSSFGMRFGFASNVPYIQGYRETVGTIDLQLQPLGGDVFIGGSLDIQGNIIVSGTIDGRDVAADGTKLDGIEASADVTDTTNVTAAGALMDSEVINLADVKALAIGGTVQAYDLVLDELASQTIITETTTARILALTDANDYIRCTNAANTIITIPSEDSGSSIDFPIGTRIEIFRATAADVSIAAEAGVTLTYAEGLRIAATNKLAAIIKTGANAWDVIGALAA